MPQLMDAWDNDSIDVDRTLSRIIHGVLHHPAQRAMGEDGAQDGRALMFKSVEEWWEGMSEEEKEDYRNKLSREGVERGDNHKEGVNDTGHGCGHPLSMHKNYAGNSSNSVEDKIASAAAGAIVGGLTSGVSGFVQQQTGIKLPGQSGDSQSSSGGLGGASGLSGFLGAASSLLGSGFQETSTPEVSNRRDADGGHTQSYTQYGRTDDGSRFAQAEYTRTDYPDGEERTDYRRYEQDEEGRGAGRREGRGEQLSGYGYEERTETRTSYGGVSVEREERRWEDSRGGYREEREERVEEDRRNEYSRDEGDRHHRHHEEERREHRGHHEEEGGGWGGEQRNEYREEYSVPPQRSEDEGSGLFGSIMRGAQNAFEDDGERRERRNDRWE